MVGRRRQEWDLESVQGLPRVRLQSSLLGHEPGRWIEFCDPVETLVDHDSANVVDIIGRVDDATTRGLFAAGFLTYEAAAAFDPALRTRPAGEVPTVWFTLFRGIRQLSVPAAEAAPLGPLAWEPDLDWTAYEAAVTRIRAAISAGDTYQANLTFRLRAPLTVEPMMLCRRVLSAQGTKHAALLELEGHTVCSVSPELFFRRVGTDIECRPMKGTARRGLTAAEDRRVALALYDSGKDRAENLMIVDMVRNDLGRVARPGSVTTRSLFDLEKYEYVHQLTSTVTARVDGGLRDTLAALFPSASITGAPKVSTMALLAEIERSPRGVYTGAIGWAGPRRRAEFNVAIRTLHVDEARGVVEAGTGGGIVWDSRAEHEYQECRTKTLFMDVRAGRFRLIETLRWQPERGFWLLERHLDRLLASAQYFDFACSRLEVRGRLEESAKTFGDAPRRVRLCLARDGRTRIDSGPLDQASPPWRLALAPTPVDRGDRFLYHKTTERSVYDAARAGRPGYDDVLLWTGDGQLTESTRANLLVAIHGRLLTPPVASGLLAGTLRAELLELGEIEEEVLTRDDLDRADDVWLINSVRGRIAVASVEDGNRVRWRNSSSDDP